MAKWMSEQFMRGLSEKVKKSLTEPFKELAKEYNSLKKIDQLPKFVEKVWDYYPKANKYEICLINLFEPGLGYAIDLSAVDETAKDKFFKRIDAFSKVDDLETIIPFPHSFGTPRCVRMFKDADGYEIDEIENEDPELAETKKSEMTTDAKTTETEAGTTTPEATGNQTNRNQTGSSDSSGNN